MKNSSLLKSSLFSILVNIIFLTSIYGQGSLRGIVTDSLSKEALVGANIIFLGTSLGSATDIDGAYRITRIPEGSYTVRVSYIGYKPKEYQVDIIGSRTLELNSDLMLEVLEGNEVIITAQAVGQRAAINQQITSDVSVNVVSADRIKELPDANAAESVGRLPGVSLIRSAGEANKVVIRGLEPKLNAITINGVKIPSTGAEDRSVDLSMISSETLEGIEVYKATLPEMDAEAVGGVVNLKIKKAPEQRTIRFKLNPGYNDIRKDYGDFKASGEFSDRFFNNILGVVSTAGYERLNRASESFGASYRVLGVRDSITGTVPIGGSAMNIQNNDEIRKRYSASLTIDYTLSNGTIWLSNFYSSTTRNPFSVNKSLSPRDDRITYSVRDQEIEIKGLQNSLNGQMFVWGMDMDWVLSRYNVITEDSYDFEMELWQGSPFDFSLMDKEKIDITTYLPASKDDINKIFLHNNYNKPGKMDQTDYAAQYNVKIPVTLTGNISGYIKLGGKYTRSNRDRDSWGSGEQFYYLGGVFVTNAQKLFPRRVILDQNARISALNFVGSSSASMNIVDDKYKFFPLYDRNIIKEWYKAQNSVFIKDRTLLAENYELRETISAGYIMAQLNLGQSFSAIAGARYEKSDNWYQSVWTSAYEAYGRSGIQRDTTTFRVYDHIFPHLHLKLKPLSGFDVIFSVNKTLSRPDFYWISPWTRLDISNAVIQRGNPDLIETKIWNYNLTTNIYNNFLGLFSFSVFNKELRDIFYQKQSQVNSQKEIEYLQIPGREGGYRMTTYTNSEKARVWGLEFELQTQLMLIPGIPEFLRGVVINANYSRIWSKTYFPFDKIIGYETVPNTRPPRKTAIYEEWEREGPMPGQAEQIANLSVGYDVGDLSTRLSLLYQGPSIRGVGQIAETDSWNNSFLRWDMSLKYRFADYLSFTFNMINITNTKDKAYFGSDLYPTSEYDYGMSVIAGFEVTL